MHETEEDLAELQALLDRSHGAGGSHLRSILQEERRISAAELPGLLTGVQILVVATVTADGRPIAGPVDGLLYRGKLHFGTSARSVRFRQLTARPHVSAVHARGEELVVVAHGEAVAIDVARSEHEAFRSYLTEVYPDWERWWGAAPPPYFRIEAAKMFASRLPSGS